MLGGVLPSLFPLVIGGDLCCAVGAPGTKAAELEGDTSKTFRESGCGEGDSSALLYSSLM